MEVQGAAVHTGIGVALRAAYHERRAQERDELQEAPVEPSEVMPETGVLWVDAGCFEVAAEGPNYQPAFRREKRPSRRRRLKRQAAAKQAAVAEAAPAEATPEEAEPPEASQQEEVPSSEDEEAAPLHAPQHEGGAPGVRRRAQSDLADAFDEAAAEREGQPLEPLMQSHGLWDLGGKS